MTRVISFAYSPDTDDAFMALAMRERRIDLKGYEFVYTTADIQTLNEAAARGIYDITAISIAAYPRVADRYWLMPVGASIGDAFGPAIVVSQGSGLTSHHELRGRRVAVPGRQTSAFIAARALIGPFTDVPLPFDRIGEAVAAGEVDAGILIHELQLDPARAGLRSLGDLGSLWHREHALPLPLGANAIRRDLGPETVRELTALLRASIEAGLADRQRTLAGAIARAKTQVDPAAGDRYISMYVNQRSLEFAPDVREAVDRLFAAGGAAGLCPPCRVADAFCE